MTTATAPSGSCTWTYHAGDPGYWTVENHCTSGVCTKDPDAQNKQMSEIQVDSANFATKVRAEFALHNKTLTESQTAMLDDPQEQNTFIMPCV